MACWSAVSDLARACVMFLERHPWIVVVGSVMTAAGAYFAVVSVNQINQSDLLGSWFFFASVFVSFAAIVLVTYRALRRVHGPTAMDEAKQK